MKQLKSIGLIEDIIVNSDCPISWEIANKEGVKIHERENYYASSRLPHNRLLEVLRREYSI